MTTYTYRLTYPGAPDKIIHLEADDDAAAEEAILAIRDQDFPDWDIHDA